MNTLKVHYNYHCREAITAKGCRQIKGGQIWFTKRYTLMSGDVLDQYTSHSARVTHRASG